MCDMCLLLPARAAGERSPHTHTHTHARTRARAHTHTHTASGVKHEAQEPAEDRAQREKLENLESLLSQVPLKSCPLPPMHKLCRVHKLFTERKNVICTRCCLCLENLESLLSQVPFKPYTLSNPTPYTLHPTPYTLHPSPYIVRPTP